jgi:Putative DNA-binding domain
MKATPANPATSALTLAPLQQMFQDFILGQHDEAAILPHIAQRTGLSCAERLSIYSNAYRIRLHDALSEAYDKTHRYLGDELFDAAANGYVEQNPSQWSNLRWYGASFPAFLQHYLPEHPVVAELAAFEWALSLAFDAEDQAILPLSALAQVQEHEWESIGFECHASVRFLPLHSNCVAIWLALADTNDTNEAEQPGTAPPDPDWKELAQPWLIWRKNLQPHFRCLSQAENMALCKLQTGQSFAEVCAMVAANEPESAAQIGHWLQTWLTDEVLHDFIHPD